jgi:hypothetical protein
MNATNLLVGKMPNAISPHYTPRLLAKHIADYTISLMLLKENPTVEHDMVYNSSLNLLEYLSNNYSLPNPLAIISRSNSNRNSNKISNRSSNKPPVILSVDEMFFCLYKMHENFGIGKKLNGDIFYDKHSPKGSHNHEGLTKASEEYEQHRRHAAKEFECLHTLKKDLVNVLKMNDAIVIVHTLNREFYGYKDFHFKPEKKDMDLGQIVTSR